MAWIEVHQSLFTHRKTLALADVLGIPEVYAAAHLISLWSWSLDNAPDGALHVRCTIIARACMWQGDADALVNALLETAFLERDEDGVLYIHDWQDYAGRLIDKRRANAQRMREARSKEPSTSVKERATHVQRTLDARAGATVPNPTVPNRTEPKESRAVPSKKAAPTPPLQDNFATFAEDVWERYPDRNGKKLNKQKFLATLKAVPARDWDAVLVGVENFSRSRQAIQGYAPDAFRWVRDGGWKEWQEPEVVKQESNGNGTHKRTLTKREQAISDGFYEAFGVPLEQAFGDRDGGEVADYSPKPVRKQLGPGQAA